MFPIIGKSLYFGMEARKRFLALTFTGEQISHRLTSHVQREQGNIHVGPLNHVENIPTRAPGVISKKTRV